MNKVTKIILNMLLQYYCFYSFINWEYTIQLCESISQETTKYNINILVNHKHLMKELSLCQRSISFIQENFLLMNLIQSKITQKSNTLLFYHS